MEERRSLFLSQLEKIRDGFANRRVLLTQEQSEERELQTPDPFEEGLLVQEEFDHMSDDVDEEVQDDENIIQVVEDDHKEVETEYSANDGAQSHIHTKSPAGKGKASQISSTELVCLPPCITKAHCPVVCYT